MVQTWQTGIEAGADRRGLHMAEVIKLAREQGAAGPPQAPPERAVE